MEFLINNWYIILALFAVVALVAILTYRFFKQPTGEQLDNVQEWLLWAVTEAEKKLGGGTGKLKLRQVYDLFVSRFPWLAPVISFKRFSSMVDDALVEMRKLLEKNSAVKALVEDGVNTEVTK